MKVTKKIWALILVFSLGFAVNTFSQTGLGVDKSKPNSKSNPTNTQGGSLGRDKKGSQKEERESGLGRDKPTPKIDVPPPPPPPNVSRISLFTNAPNLKDSKTIVLVNGKPYPVDEQGAVTKLIDLKGTTTAVVEVTNPDFLPFKEKIEDLKVGQGITKVVKLISKYGEIKLSGMPEEVKIFIDENEIPKESWTEEKSADGTLVITLKHIPTGTRQLRLEHPDYITKNNPVEVLPGEESSGATGLDLATADINLISTPLAKVYVDGEQKAQVLPDGKLLLQVKPGDREIRIVKDGYIEKKLTEKLAIGPKDITIKLAPIPNTGEFFEPFNTGLERWDAPSDWKVDEKAKLHVQGTSKLGFPKKAVFRDLDGQFTVKMLNGKGLAWALRVNGDQNNYYLFYLSGPKGKTPNMLRTYICKDGNLDLTKFVQSIKVNVVTLSPDYFYSIRISVRGNKIETFIKPNDGPEAGTEIPLDVYTDEEHTFTYGNIGFTTIDGEEVLVDDVGVKPVETEEEKAGKIAQQKAGG